VRWGEAMNFGIFRPVDGRRDIWLVHAFPFIQWGPQTGAARYSTERLAQQAITQLRPKEVEGAVVAALE
jgi:hypothetical protein